MKSLMFVSFCKYKNSLKKLYKKPILGIMFLLFVVFIFVRMSTVLTGKTLERSGNFEIFVSSAMLFIGFIFSVMVSRNMGMFFLPDVNILFTAPLKKSKILIYSIYENGIFSLLFSFVVIVYLSGSVGTISLINHFFAFLLIALTMYYTIVIYLVIYLLSIEYKNITKYMSYFVYGIVSIMVIEYFVIFKTNGDMFNSLKEYFTSIYFNLIPILGWTKYGIISIYNNNIIDYSAILLVNIFILAAAISYILNSKIDFYENALLSGGKAQELRDKAMSGKLDVNSYNTKKVKNVESDFDEGAKAILDKQRLELRKTKYFFDKKQFLLGTFYIVLFSKVNFLGAGYGLYTVLFMLCILQISTVSNETWISEFKRPFIYLIPESSIKKSIYISAAKIYEYIITGILFFVIIYFFQKPNIITLISFFILFISYKMLFLYSIFLSQRFVGIIESMLLTVFIRLICSYIVSLPSVITVIVLVMLKTGDITIALTGVIINVIIIAFVLFSSRKVFEVAEIND